MQTYWRINEELKFLGEVLVFHDPSLKRCYEEWVHRKADVLSILGTDDGKGIAPVLQFLISLQKIN
jgi:hypothetical protein